MARRPNQPKPPATREERQVIVTELAEWAIRYACEQHPDLNLFVTYDLQPNYWTSDDPAKVSERCWTVRIYEEAPDSPFTRYRLDWSPSGFACHVHKIMEKMVPMSRRRTMYVGWRGDAGWQEAGQNAPHLVFSGRYKGISIVFEIYSITPPDVWDPDEFEDLEEPEDLGPESAPEPEQTAPVTIGRRALRLRPSAVIVPLEDT